MKVYGFDLVPWPYLDKASYYPDPNRLYDPARGTQIYTEHLDQMAYFEECGFDAVCMNEHHAKPYGLMPSPNLMAAALIQKTRTIKIAIFGNLPALHANPIRLAEEVAMLDVMSGGRIISGFVRGVPQEFLAYSIPIEEARPRMQEAWDLIVKAWTSREPFDWHGTFFRYERISIWPRPVQQPHPPIVMPADSEEGIEIAVRRRVPTGTAYRSLARQKATLDRFRSLAAKAGWTPSPEDCLMVRHVYVAETNERARQESEPHLNYFWQKLLSYHRGSMALMGQSAPPRKAVIETAEDLPLYEFDFDVSQKHGMSIIGDPDYVTRELRAQASALGAGTLIAFFHFGSMPTALAKKNIKLFSEHVLPEVKRG